MRQFRQTIVFLASALLVAASARPRGGQRVDTAKADDRQPKASARLEAKACDDCMTVRFLLKNEGEEPLEIVHGHGRSGQSLVPLFRIGDTTITPSMYLQSPRRGMQPDILTVPAHKEVLYGTYILASPHGPGLVPEEKKFIEADFEYTPRGQRKPMLRLRAEPIPWPKPQHHRGEG